MRRFAFRLALRLGRADVDGMLRSMTARQFREWSVFAELEPFGEDREDARFGSIVQIISNVHRDRKKKRAPFELYECTLAGGDVPTPEEVAAARPPTTWRRMKEIAKEIATQWMEGRGGG